MLGAKSDQWLYAKSCPKNYLRRQYNSLPQESDDGQSPQQSSVQVTGARRGIRPQLCSGKLMNTLYR